MSRALNLSVPEAEVAALCNELGIIMTSIEPLLPTGTRVVCRTKEGTLALQKKFRTKIIEGSIRRAPRSVNPSMMR